MNADRKVYIDEGFRHFIMATEYTSKAKWKRDVNYIADLVSDINQKMDHIVREMRDTSQNLEHLLDGYSGKGRQKRYSSYQDDAGNGAC